MDYSKFHIDLNTILEDGLSTSDEIIVPFLYDLLELKSKLSAAESLIKEQFRLTKPSVDGYTVTVTQSHSIDYLSDNEYKVLKGLLEERTKTIKNNQKLGIDVLPSIVGTPRVTVKKLIDNA